MAVLKAPLSGATTFDKKRYEKLLLVDADFLKYYVTSDISKYWERSGDPAEKYGPDYLMHFVNEQLENNIFKKISCWGFVFCFSGGRKDTFRYHVAIEKEYKGTRSTAEEKYSGHYSDMAKVISCVGRNNPIVFYPDLEADDIISAIQNEHTIVYSHDKDMKQIPGLHYDLSKNELVQITEEKGFANLAMQMILGDTTDNIAGIPGAGPATMNKLLEPLNESDYMAAILKEYVVRFGKYEGIDRFCENWTLLHLRRDRGDWFKSKIAGAYETRDTIINMNFKP